MRGHKRPWRSHWGPSTGVTGDKGPEGKGPAWATGCQCSNCLSFLEPHCLLGRSSSPKPGCEPRSGLLGRAPHCLALGSWSGSVLTCRIDLCIKSRPVIWTNCLTSLISWVSSIVELGLKTYLKNYKEDCRLILCVQADSYQLAGPKYYIFKNYATWLLMLLIAWNWPWWECLHHKNWRMLFKKLSVFSF